MSLLIKALDNAEKNKKAEKANRTAGENLSASPVLELQAIEHSDSSDLPPTKTKSDEDALKASKQNFADKGLSLEEEAGLSLSLDTKYAKPKRSAEKNIETNEDKLSAKTLEKPKTYKADSQESSGINKAPVLPAVFQTIAAQNHDTNQKAAAKVFVANQSIRTNSSKTALLILGVAGALMIWLGLQGYTYIKALMAPAEVVVVKPTSPNPQEMATVAAEAAQITQGSTETNALPVSTGTEVPEKNALAQANIDSNPNKTTDVVETHDDAVVKPSQESNSLAVAKTNAKNSRSQKTGNDDAYVDDVVADNPSKSPIKLISKQQANGVDPTLLSAYQAFTRGEDSSAQQQYRQVLQRDVRNVDALLGMAAIAQRQGRDADAFGWYQKVLEIEPKNTVAQSALVNASNVDSTATESKIKSMLAQQPEAAHLHEALGNLYAEQNQWPSAQDAYFNASRYAPNNADYAFNLAISLDHLGKSSLALIQYQRALDLVNRSGAVSPDKAQLETRIRALQ
ncbi:MAG TPA: tetratricopeptide repeat protein [Methylotenera sp.]|nr:tetratricopeptide repeat protein [Methylotenera sp.]